uniref:Protein TAPETUM DETERMINANT 1-like n=1 Tax=Kalanchoe fedtschenkoi TaxID=63787 RepID=A0A7N0T1V9_KALFE
MRRRSKSALLSAIFILVIIIIIIILLVSCTFFITISSHSPGSSSNLTHESHNHSATATPPTRPHSSSHRKLQVFGTCNHRDISISQSRDSTSGIPSYIVQIINTCVSGCAPSHIHLHCGWFASTRLVNPATFKRLSYDDCFVNGGKPLMTGQIIRFTYLNSFMYPLSFKSARFC